jgi:hypothetical protein
MTFLTIDEINSNPAHAPIDDETNFNNRIKADIIKTFLGLSIHRKINAKTVPNEFYRQVILRWTNIIILTDDVTMAENYPRYDTTFDEELGGVELGYGCDWNEKALCKGTTKEVRTFFKELTEKILIKDCCGYFLDSWDEAFRHSLWGKPCPIIGYNSDDPGDPYDARSELRLYRKKGWLK